MTKGKKSRSHAAGKSKDEIERKRDDRARKNALKKEREIKEYLENDENFVSFSNQLQVVGYKIKDIKGDGNCLFRALADQLDGDDSGHLRHRRIIAKYLADHREEFEPFVEDNKPFDNHVQELSKPGTYGGNDSIVAFSRNYGVNIVIHQLNEPCWVIQGNPYAPAQSVVKELHISYHNGDHYSSVRRIGDPDNGPAWEYNNKQTKVKDKTAQCKADSDHSKEKTKANKEGYICEGAEALTEPNDIAIIKAATGCQDDELITQTLLESNYDMDAAISYILQVQSVIDVELQPSLQRAASPEEELIAKVETIKEKGKITVESNVTCKESGPLTLPENVSSVSQMSHPPAKGARPKVKQHHLSNTKRKQLAKQEKKARRMEERREEAQRNHQPRNQVDHNLELTGNLEALAI